MQRDEKMRIEREERKEFQTEFVHKMHIQFYFLHSTHIQLFPVPFRIISIPNPILECLLSIRLECSLILTPADLLDSQSHSIPSGREAPPAKQSISVPYRLPTPVSLPHTHPAPLLSFARHPLVIYGCSRRGCSREAARAA